MNLGLGLDINNIQRLSQLNLLFTSASSFTVAENQAAVGTVAATPTGGTYSIKAGGDAASFAINGSTGVLTGVANFDYETKNSYSLTVVYTKGSAVKEQTITVAITNVVEAPTGLTSQFIVNTILTQLNWTDNEGGAAAYEIYSATNGEAEVLLATTAAGVITYNDTTCKQNASVVYRIRAKNGANYSGYVAASALVTPICWKTNQATPTNIVINTLNISAGKTVNINWDDGTNNNYTGNNANITKIYSVPGQYNISFTGDVINVTDFAHYGQVKSYGDITNWRFPTGLGQLYIEDCQFSGDLTNWSFLANRSSVFMRNNLLTGKTPNIITSATAINIQLYSNRLSGCNTTTFRVNMGRFSIESQQVSFPTVEIDKLLKAAADWYQVNQPTSNCTFTMQGVNMGIPSATGLADRTRLIGYYTAAGKTCTVTVQL